MRIVIAAAGLGSRLKSHIPKPLYPIRGIPNLQRLIDAAKVADCPINIVLGHRAKEIEAWIFRFNKEPSITVSYNSRYLTDPPMISYQLGAFSGLSESNSLNDFVAVLCADLVIEPKSLISFLTLAKENELAGVSDVRSSSGLTTVLEKDMIIDINSSREGMYEWGNFLSIHSQTLLQSREPLMSSLVSKHLPFPAFITSCIDIDTPSDVLAAESFDL